MSDDRGGLNIGDTVGEKYRLVKLIGEGSHGRVYHAVNTLIDRDVAIKVLRPDLLGDESFKQRLFREARTASLVRHPNVVQVLDVGDSATGPWIAQELLSGEPLSEVLAREGALTTERTIELLLPVISALALAHSKGVAHRDFKPANVFITLAEGGARVPKLLDFGLSKSTLQFGSPQQRDSITSEGTIVGTPAYLAPERLRAECDGDAHGDVWSIGVVLFECTTGMLPYVATSQRELYLKISRGDVLSILELDANIDPRFVELVARCLSVAPSERFDNAGQLADKLRRILRTNHRRTAKRARRREQDNDVARNETAPRVSLAVTPEASSPPSDASSGDPPRTPAVESAALPTPTSVVADRAAPPRSAGFDRVAFVLLAVFVALGAMVPVTWCARAHHGRSRGRPRHENPARPRSTLEYGADRDRSVSARSSAIAPLASPIRRIRAED